LLFLLPALGAAAANALARWLAPETAGVGGDNIIRAFHQKVSTVRRRVAAIKPIVTILTLATGGSGGREGPTMQIGGALGSVVARYLGVSQRERRILLVAGMAAGTAAIFRTPLGAALLAVEVLYRDDFEADALVPAVLASVVSYSVFIGFYGEANLLATAESYPFVVGHLPLYATMALLLCGVGVAFVRIIRAVEQLSLRWPEWARAGIGGLAVGILATLMVVTIGESFGMGLMGGGYGAAEAAIVGADWLPEGSRGVQLLLLLCVAKMLTTAFTVGTGGSAGAFGPSLAIGGLLGGAFGRLLQLYYDPSLDPGAFALVGMGTMYGGIAHAPLGTLVIVCEMAGSYDLLVPLMLTLGIAYVALRNVSLYRAQLPRQQDSPAHPARVLDVLGQVRVEQVMMRPPDYVQFKPGTPVAEVTRRVSETNWQDVFPVVDKNGQLVGMITPDLLRVLAAERDLEGWALAVDAMQPAVTVGPDDDLRVASERMLTHGLRELMVIDDSAHICGFIDEAEVGRTYLDRLV
jgi:CIC family chloride channel protein